jgi:hypothetical protein
MKSEIEFLAAIDETDASTIARQLERLNLNRRC